MPANPTITPPGPWARRRWWGLVATLATVVLVAGLVLAAVTRTGEPENRAVQPATTQTTSRQVGKRTIGLAARGRSSGGVLPIGAAAGNAHTNPATISLTHSYVSDIEMSGSLLIIPSLGVRAPLVPTGAVGAPEAASLTVPADIHEVGWWDGKVRDGKRTVQENAPAPGQPGVALVAGHVDSAAEGPGALFYLGELRVGDRIEIYDSASHLSTWVVDSPPQTTPKAELPPALWVTTGPPKLALVTCGGPFDEATGHYVDNVIVWARQLSQPKAR
ncbi:MAG TPA: class F sortase [Acidimicrobiales bacterium]|nr:class F sortase [Acidimicrobiales bacterium]